MGRSDLFLKLEIAKKVVGMIALLATMWISVMAMAYSLLVTSVISQLINSGPNRKLINYNYIEQLKDMFPQICISLVMGAVVYFIPYIGLGKLVTLIIQVVVGALIYIALSKIFKIESFEYIYGTVKEFMKKRSRKEA